MGQSYRLSKYRLRIYRAAAVIKKLRSVYFRHNVGKNAAALAYYLIFAVFPLIIFVSNLVGLLQLDIVEILQLIRPFMPSDVLRLVQNYLEHISATSSRSLLWFSLIFTIWFPYRAAKGLMYDIRIAYKLGSPKKSVNFSLRRLIYTVVLLIALGRTLAVSTFGLNVTKYIAGIFMPDKQHIPLIFLSLWQYMRFVLAAAVMFVALGMLYRLSLDEKQPLRHILPGITAAVTCWLAVSVGFSFYVENFADYSVIYGALGAVMMLLVWLYMTAVILIMGAELNAVLQDSQGKIE